MAKYYYCNKRLIFIDDRFQKCIECIKKGLTGMLDKSICIQKNIVMKEREDDCNKF